MSQQQNSQQEDPPLSPGAQADAAEKARATQQADQPMESVAMTQGAPGSPVAATTPMQMMQTPEKSAVRHRYKSQHASLGLQRLVWILMLLSFICCQFSNEGAATSLMQFSPHAHRVGPGDGSTSPQRHVREHLASSLAQTNKLRLFARAIVCSLLIFLDVVSAGTSRIRSRYCYHRAEC